MHGATIKIIQIGYFTIKKVSRQCGNLKRPSIKYATVKGNSRAVETVSDTGCYVYSAVHLELYLKLHKFHIT